MRKYRNYLVLFLSAQMLQIVMVDSKLYSKLIGIYSICNNGTTANNNNIDQTQTNLSQDAYITNKTIYDQIFHDGRWSTPNKQTRQIQFEYVSFDICYNETLLKNLLVDFLLHETYYHERQPHQPVCTNPSSCLVPNIAMLVAYVPEHFSKLISSFTKLSGYIKLCQPVTCEELENDPEIIQKVLADKLIYLNWTNIFYVHLNMEGLETILFPIYEESYRYAVETRQFNSKGLSMNIRNDTDLKSLLLLVGEMCQTENRAIVIFTDNGLTEKVIKQMNDSSPMFRDLNILFYNFFALDDVGTPDNWLNINNGPALEIFDRRYTIFNALAIAEFIEIFFFFFKLEIRFECDRSDECSSTPTNKMYKSTWREMKLSLYGEQHQLATLDNKPISSIIVKPSRNKQLYCRPGHHKWFVSLESLARPILLYNRTDSMRCVLCPANHYKIHYGDNACMKCVHPTSIDNGDRTGCIDPFTHTNLRLAVAQQAIVASLGTLGVILNIAILLVFYIKRDTPIVKTTDMTISCTQLAILLLLHLGNMYVHVDMTLILPKCIAQNLLLTVLYAANIGLVFTKSQKLMGAYLSKTRVSKSSIRRTNAAQIFTVFLFLFISNCLLGILYAQREPMIDNFLDHVNKYRVNFCATSSNDGVICGFLIAGQLACLVQAFRARNLPSLMNDSMSILYAVFISTITMSTSYPIMHFQTQLSDKDFVRCIVVMLNSFVYVVLLYGKKFVLVVFQPHKNTKLYFTEKFRKQVFSNNGF